MVSAEVLVIDILNIILEKHMKEGYLAASR